MNFKEFCDTLKFDADAIEIDCRLFHISAATIGHGRILLDGICFWDYDNETVDFVHSSRALLKDSEGQNHEIRILCFNSFPGVES